MLTEVMRQENKDFIELLQRVQYGTHTEDDIKCINNMKNNNVSQDKAIYVYNSNKQKSQ